MRDVRISKDRLKISGNPGPSRNCLENGDLIKELAKNVMEQPWWIHSGRKFHYSRGPVSHKKVPSPSWAFENLSE